MLCKMVICPWPVSPCLLIHNNILLTLEELLPQLFLRHNTFQNHVPGYIILVVRHQHKKKVERCSTAFRDLDDLWVTSLLFTWQPTYQLSYESKLVCIKIISSPGNWLRFFIRLLQKKNNQELFLQQKICVGKGITKTIRFRKRFMSGQA